MAAWWIVLIPVLLLRQHVLIIVHLSTSLHKFIVGTNYRKKAIVVVSIAVELHETASDRSLGLGLAQLSIQ